MIVRHTAPTRIRRRGVEMKLVLEASGAAAAAPNPAFIKAVVRAHRWFDDFATGRVSSFAEIAKAEGVTKRYVGHLMPLAFLAPDTVEAIFAGIQPPDLTAEKLVKRIDLPLDWAEQRHALGFNR